MLVCCALGEHMSRRLRQSSGNLRASSNIFMHLETVLCCNHVLPPLLAHALALYRLDEYLHYLPGGSLPFHLKRL